jgi:hypothetical protein
MPLTIGKFRLDLPQAVAAAVVIIACVFLLTRLHSGHPMDEDFSVYLKEAVNIAHGRPVAETGVVYILDRQATLEAQAPATYPPILPLIFAPFVGVLGLNFPVLKLVQLTLLFSGFGLLAAFHKRLGFSLFEACASIALFCLLPEIVWQVNDVSSDLPFLFFLVAALLAIETQLAAPPERRVRAGILAGIAIFAAFDTRTVGVALLPAAALALIVLEKRQLRPNGLFIPGAVFALLWLIQSKLTSQQSAYSYVLDHKFFDVVATLKSFYWHMLKPWDGTGFALPATAIILALAALAAIGVLDGMRRGQAAAWFCSVYFAMLLVLPNFDAGLRYLVPVFLFLGAFAARGAEFAAGMLRLDRRKAAIPAAVFIAATMLLMLRVLPANAPLPSGVLAPNTSQVFAFLKDHTEPGSLLAVSKYRAFHLFTGRLTIHPPLRALRSAGDLSRWLAENHVGYLVLKTSPSLSGSDYSDCPQWPLCGSPLDETAKVFGNADYQVFKLRK